MYIYIYYIQCVSLLFNEYCFFTSSFFNRGFLNWGSAPCPPCPRPWRPVFPPRWMVGKSEMTWVTCPKRKAWNGLNVVFQSWTSIDLTILTSFFSLEIQKNKCIRMVTDHGTDLDHGKQLAGPPVWENPLMGEMMNDHNMAPTYCEQ